MMNPVHLANLVNTVKGFPVFNHQVTSEKSARRAVRFANHYSISGARLIHSALTRVFKIRTCFKMRC